MINTKLYLDILSRQAKKDGRSHEMALSDFCDFLLDLFSVEAFKGKGADNLKNWFDERIGKKPDFGLLATNWLVDVSTALSRRALGSMLSAFFMRICIYHAARLLRQGNFLRLRMFPTW